MRSIVLICAMLLAGCGSGGVDVPGGNAERGRALAAEVGCGGCHRLSGVRGGDGQVGPSLDGFAQRRTIAGAVPNSPANLERWLLDPQAVAPNTLMPDLHLTRGQARDIAAYLEETR